MNHLTIVAGARPNFVKVAPIIHEIERIKQVSEIDYLLVHTGQHYDEKMSGAFFDELRIPPPNANLNAGIGTQSQQAATIMIRFEEHLILNPTDIVLVVGDVTSTMACAITARKLGIKVAHVEAGIRSNDWSMPEEINRLITDSITDYFFTTSEIANSNLRLQGVKEDRIFFVGNCMIDTLLKNRNNFVKPKIWNELNLSEKGFIVITLHRPANVDKPSNIKEIIDEVIAHSRELPILFPVHPRTRKLLSELDIDFPQLYMLDPLSYLEFNYLVYHSMGVITDSGGITEETTVMGVPCMTLRDNTERPETVTIGTNELIGTNPKNIGPSLQRLFGGNWKKGNIPPLWDGKSAARIVDVLKSL